MPTATLPPNTPEWIAEWWIKTFSAPNNCLDQTVLININLVKGVGGEDDESAKIKMVLL